MTLTDHPIFALPKLGAGPGLHRVEALLDALGLGPYLERTPRIAVTGTNGKGSTAKLCAEILRHSGRRTGLFTSPHLYRFNERIEIGGSPAADEALAPAANEVLAAIGSYERAHAGDTVGAFEAFFILAVLAFQRAGCDALVLEAGIGGRYDAVRMARARLGAVVSVDLDHTDILGKSLALIALDKLEIVAPGGIAVLGPSLTPLAGRIGTHARLIGVSPVFIEDACRIRSGAADAQGASLSLKVEDLSVDRIRLALAGRHQADNLAVAAFLARRLLGTSHGLADALRQAAAGTRWPGRLERVHDDPAITVDVGHSPAAIEAALASFAAHTRLEDSLLVLGCSRDKNAEAMVKLLAPRFSRILATSAHHKGAPAAGIESLARAANPTAEIEVVEPIARAAERALAICRKEGRAGYAAGGLFLAAELAYAIRGGDPRALRFF
jgi:dihydrofolate synthase/folylpolyglutamate synthase